MRKTEDKIDEYLKGLGDSIKKHRITNALTLEELGLLIGLDPASIYNLEKGRNTTVITLVKLSIALNKKPVDFLKLPFKFEKGDLDFMIKSKSRKK